MRTGRIGPLPNDDHERIVWSLRFRWKPAQRVSTWLRVSWSSGGKFCNCIAVDTFLTVRCKFSMVCILEPSSALRRLYFFGTNGTMQQIAATTKIPLDPHKHWISVNFTGTKLGYFFVHSIFATCASGMDEFPALKRNVANTARRTRALTAMIFLRLSGLAFRKFSCDSIANIPGRYSILFLRPFPSTN